MPSSRVNLASDGPELSRIIAGVMRLNDWGLDDQGLLGWIESCIGMGVTTFDHADIYGSYTCEGIFGRALTLRPSLRDQMEIVTKCGIRYMSENRPEHRVKHYDTSREHITWSVENSLRELQTDRIDLLLIHRPDALMDPAEIAETFQKLHQEGKVLHFGVSNFTPSQFDLLQSALPMQLVTNQLELHILNLPPFHNGELDHCMQHGIAPMAWSPLAGGRIFRGEISEQSARVQGMLHQIGDELGGAGPDQVALAWLMRHPARILPVLGTGNLDRIRSAVDAESLSMSRDQWYLLWEASNGRRVP